MKYRKLLRWFFFTSNIIFYTASVQAGEGFGCSPPAEYAVDFPQGYADCGTDYHAIHPAPFNINFLYKTETGMRAALLAKLQSHNAGCTLIDFYSTWTKRYDFFFGGIYYSKRWEAPIYCNSVGTTNSVFNYYEETVVCKPGYHVIYVQAANYQGDGTYHPYICGLDRHYVTPGSLTNESCNGDTEGNPCNPATGNKLQLEDDFAATVSGLGFRRYYQSQGIGDGYPHLGVRWRHNFSAHMDTYVVPDYQSYSGVKSNLYTSKSLACTHGWLDIKELAFGGMLADSNVVTVVYQDDLCLLKIGGRVVATLSFHKNGIKTPFSQKAVVHKISRPDGAVYTFAKQNEQWLPVPYHPVKLAEIADGWQFTDRDDSVEIFEDSGRLLSRTGPNRLTSHFSYDTKGRLETVNGPFNRQLLLSYNADNHLHSVTTPTGIISYGYDGDGNLVSAQYPDNTAETQMDNPVRYYLYENADFPHHLTGVIDANGERYATWDYDSQGRAILSEHADGAERVEFTYNSDGTTTVNDALGAVRTYSFTLVQGSLRVKNIEGDPCVSCANGHMKTRSYDDYGFLSAYSDWGGQQTKLENNSRGLPVCRMEAYGTAQVRLFRTDWQADYRLPTQSELYAPPESASDFSPTDCTSALQTWSLLKTTRYQYDAQGRLQSRAEVSH